MFTVAICDDEQYFVNSLQKSLNQYFSVRKIESSFSVFTDAESLLSAKRDYDLILMDLKLPGMDGMEAVTRLLGAVMAFVMILIGFDKVITLAQQETESALLNAQHKEQEIYLAEAQKREEQYRSFQHDIDNHLAVLSGLLQEEKYDEAKQYFLQLHESSSALGCHITTGTPALDVLLGEKISYARQNHITVSCHASLPPGVSVGVMDVCIIIANALDNAIKACIQDYQNKPDITITVQPRHQFLLLEVTNSISSEETISYGTGLSNISRTVDKYQGSMELEQTDGRFRLSVLLCLGGGDI